MKDLSEFTASQNLELFVKDNQIVGSEEGAKLIQIAKGEKIPTMFITGFLLHNRNFIDNLPYINGIPSLTPEQEKKYDVTFTQPKPQKMKIKAHRFTQEKLTQKLNKIGSKKFKEWAEEEFGEKEIDKRKGASNLIYEILRIQEEEKRE